MVQNLVWATGYNAFEAEIQTKDGSLVDKLLVEKSAGWMHPANQ